MFVAVQDQGHLAGQVQGVEGGRPKTGVEQSCGAGWGLWGTSWGIPHAVSVHGLAEVPPTACLGVL